MDSKSAAKYQYFVRFRKPRCRTFRCSGLLCVVRFGLLKQALHYGGAFFVAPAQGVGIYAQGGACVAVAHAGGDGDGVDVVGK